MEQEEQPFFTESRQKVEQYIQDRLLLIKLQMVEKISRLAALLFTGITLALLSFFILLFISMMAGYFFANLTGSLYIGFAIVAAFYLVLLIVLLKLRKNFIEKYITDAIIKIFFDKMEDEADESSTT